MEERSDGILLRAPAAAGHKLSWEETAREMAGSDEDWSDWDVTTGDGLDDLSWTPIQRGRAKGPAHGVKFRQRTRR